MNKNKPSPSGLGIYAKNENYDLIKKFMDVIIESLNYNLELIVKSVYLK